MYEESETVVWCAVGTTESFMELPGKWKWSYRKKGKEGDRRENF